MKLSKHAIFAAILTFPLLAHAHVRWFSEFDATRKAQFTLDLISIALVLGTLGYWLLCISIEYASRKSATASKLIAQKFTFGAFDWDLLKSSIAVMMIGNIVSNTFIAPNLATEVIGNDLCILIQAAIIVCLSINELFLAASLLVALVSIFSLYGFSLSIDYAAEFLALAIVFAIIGLNKLKADKVPKRLKPYITSSNAARVLRVGFGLQLAILAIHNKFMNPVLGLDFLALYPYFNFIKVLGFAHFKDIHFVLSAGLAELSFGLLLILNIATRFVSLCAIFCFTVTSIVLGIHELVGHTPILVGLFIIFLHTTNGSILNKRSRANRFMQALGSTKPLTH